MNAKRKTYGVRGMMEWAAILKCGKFSLKVHFSGGSMTSYGTKPATFTTENPMTQSFIENSEQFKSKKIYIVRVSEGTGKYANAASTAKPRAKVVKKVSHIGGAAATATAILDSTLSAANEEAESTEGQPIEETEDQPIEETEDQPIGETEGNATVVEVTDLDAARHYLKDRFEIASSRMRKSDVLNAADEHGFVFKFAE